MQSFHNIEAKLQCWHVPLHRKFKKLRFMAKNYSEMVSFFDTQIAQSGATNYNQLYIGITNDINRRLFGEHNVDEKNDWWAWANAKSKEIAQQVEQHYLDKGMQGDTGGGTVDSTYVYCYFITNKTVQ